jgi:hypothetical protein
MVLILTMETIANIHNYCPHIFRKTTEINIHKINKEGGPAS